MRMLVMGVIYVELEKVDEAQGREGAGAQTPVQSSGYHQIGRPNREYHFVSALNYYCDTSFTMGPVVVLGRINQRTCELGHPRVHSRVDRTAEIEQLKKVATK